VLRVKNGTSVLRNTHFEASLQQKK